jgi:hypothetical protein
VIYTYAGRPAGFRQPRAIPNDGVQCVRAPPTIRLQPCSDCLSLMLPMKSIVQSPSRSDLNIARVYSGAEPPELSFPILGHRIGMFGLQMDLSSPIPHPGGPRLPIPTNHLPRPECCYCILNLEDSRRCYCIRTSHQ